MTVVHCHANSLMNNDGASVQSQDLGAFYIKPCLYWSHFTHTLLPTHDFDGVVNKVQLRLLNMLIFTSCS